MTSEFELLKAEGVLGFYQSCEVTMVIIHNKKTRQTYNYYTLIAFEERASAEEEGEFLFNENLGKDLSMGVFRYHLTMEEVTEAYDHLLQHQVWKHKDNEIPVCDLKKENKKFIKCDGTTHVPLNSILKNNFHNGSYVIEFFDVKKSLLEVISDTTIIDKINSYIKRQLPIDLQYLNDRIGNIIFQFPSNLLEVEYGSTEEWDGLNVKLTMDERIPNKDHYVLAIADDYDETVSSFHLTSNLDEEEFKVVTGNSKSHNTVQVIDTRNQLLLSSQTTSFIQYLGFNMDFSTEFSKPRTIVKETDGSTKEIEVLSQNPFGDKRELTAKDWIGKRKYKNEKEALAERLEFVQYGKNKNEQTKALDDIRKLINSHGREGVYLWDPYLTYEDLIKTLYYCKFGGVQMKAITSFDKKRKHVYQQNLEEPTDDLTVEDWYCLQKDGMTRSSNHHGINLEFRCQHASFGWKFHDRFLIFPSQNQEPKVWSLGTSVNGLGKNHHILQSVTHPQNIIDAFNELWNGLDDENCVIWRSPH